MTTGLTGEFAKSSYSNPSGNCIEGRLCTCTGHVEVRDSKDTAIPGLTFSAEAWKSFATAL